MKLLDIVKYRLNLPLNKELENRPKKVSLFKKVSMATLIFVIYNYYDFIIL